VISNAWLKSNHGKTRTKRIEKADRDGLSVRLTVSGKAVFQMRYRYGGKHSRVDIGSYPLVSLKEARTESLRLRRELEQGYDPKIVRLKEKHIIVTASNLQDLFLEWYQKYCIENKKNHHEVKRSFELHVFPKLGKFPIGEITLQQWLALLEGVAKTRQAIADRLLTNTKQMLKWAVKRQVIERNVLSDINAKEDLQIRKRATTRVFSDEEIGLFYEALNGSRITFKNKLYLKLCLIYGCRNGELRLSKKADFDFGSKVWTVPPENHKMGKASGKPLLRPIIDETERLIKQACELSPESDYLFTNNGTNDPMGNCAPLQLPYNIMQWLRRNKAYEMPHWSLHDLRRTARTNFSTLTQPHIAEIILGHSLGKIWHTYDQHHYLDEQREAYEKWVVRLKGLIGGEL